MRRQRIIARPDRFDDESVGIVDVESGKTVALGYLEPAVEMWKGEPGVRYTTPVSIVITRFSEVPTDGE